MKEHTFLVGFSVLNYAWGLWRAKKTKDFDSRRRVIRNTHILSLLLLVGAGLAFFNHHVQLAVKSEQARSTPQPEVSERARLIPQPKVSPTSNFRILKNISGVEIEAEIISFDGMNVTIRRKDGMTFTNPLSIYSKTDRDMITLQYGAK